MNIFLQFISDINSIICGRVYIIFILLCAIYFTVRLSFPQFKFIKQSLKAVTDSTDNKSGISPIKAFATTLGSRIGVGNIAGIASAIALGGPGSIFWMWIFGIFASGLAVAESIAGQIYKIKNGDEYLGGPSYFICNLFGGKKIAIILACIFAMLGIIGNGFLLSGVQTNTVVDSIVNGFGFDENITIFFTVVITTLIIWGGIKRIGAFESIITSLKLIGYFGFGLIVILWNWENLSTVFYEIFTSAWGISPLFGGIIGQAVAIGVRRGIFSSDVGFGSGGIFSAAARSKHPMEQGLLQGLSVLITTFITCTLSAIIILSSDTYQVLNTTINNEIIYTGTNFPGTDAGATWVQAALNTVPILQDWAPQVLSILIVLFAAGSILGNYYLAECNLRYLLKKKNKLAVIILKITYVIVLWLSTMVTASEIWNIADTGMALMCWINLTCMLLLSPKIANIVKDYSKAIKEKNVVQYNPQKYNIEDKTGAWKL